MVTVISTAGLGLVAEKKIVTNETSECTNVV